MITLNHLQLSFGGRAILKDVNLSIREGECIAVVGPNGCGKSTLLRVIAGHRTRRQGRGARSRTNTPSATCRRKPTFPPRTPCAKNCWTPFPKSARQWRRCNDLEHQMGTIDHHERGIPAQVLERYADCTHFIEHRDGYALDAQIGRVSCGLGLPLRTLSGPAASFRAAGRCACCWRN